MVVLLNIFQNEDEKNSITWIFCDTIKVFAVTFDQFNASLLNKSIYFFNISAAQREILI